MHIRISTAPPSIIRAGKLMLALTALAVSAAAQGTLTTLYSFVGGTSGAYPAAGVLPYSGGTLVGTTPYDGTGSANYGTVYRLTPGTGGTWTQTVLYSFHGGSDGANPQAALTIGPDAVLYGTTYAGGSTGNGTVFRLTPPKTGGAWTETVLYSFQGGSDGSGPLGSVIVDATGVLAGTTFNGGTASAGTAFLLTSPESGTGPWTETIIHNFSGGKDGSGPQSGLTLGKDVLYGTTCCGSEGTVFQLHESAGTWTKTLLFSFSRYDEGAFPGGVIVDSNGVIYGTTSNGGSGGAGIVYSLTKPTEKGEPWTLTTIHSFTGGSDGGSPYAALTLGADGVLYGTVTTGCVYGAGGVVEFTPPASAGDPWTETVLYSFTGLDDGSQPFAGLALSGSSLYGTTAFGGAPGYGTVFELVP